MTPLNSGRVALFSTRFVPYSQTFIHDEVRSHERYDIDVFCKERLNAKRFPYDEDRVYRPPSWAKKIYENVAYWPSFDRRLRTGDYALIHAHFGTAAVYTLPYVIRYDLPLIVTFHGSDVAKLFGHSRFFPRQWRYWALSSSIFRHADRLLAASRELAALLAELGADSNKIAIHRVGVDLAKFDGDSEPRTPPRISLVGRLTEKKGFRYALQACVHALQDGSEAEVVVLGSGPLEDHLKRIAAEGNILYRVDFRGVVPHDEVARVLSHTDVLMTPSVVTRTHDRDSGIMVAKEASACGVPVIGTYHGGIPSIIDDGETGFLVPERNVEALANRLQTLLNNPEQRRRMGQAARAKMEREFDLHDQVQKLERHYDEVRGQSPTSET